MNREKFVILSTHSAYNIFYTHSDMVAFTLTYTVGSTDPGTGQIYHILNKFICIMLDHVFFILRILHLKLQVKSFRLLIPFCWH